jgi:hypothetical protein
MRSIAVSLSVTGLFLLFSACDKKDDQPTVHEKGLRGKVIYTSCVTTAIQILNRDIGSSWKNCHDQQTYQHMIDATIVNVPAGLMAPGTELLFDIVEGDNYPECYMLDCAPAVRALIRIYQN